MSNLLLHTLLPQEIGYFSKSKDHWVMYWVARWFSSFFYLTRLTIWVANKHFQMGNCEGFHLDKNKKILENIRLMNRTLGKKLSAIYKWDVRVFPVFRKSQRQKVDKLETGNEVLHWQANLQTLARFIWKKDGSFGK